MAWQQWKDNIWESFRNEFQGCSINFGVVAFEQYALRSKKEHRCIECGELGTVKHNSILVACVSYYWMCNDCDNHWRNKN